MKFVILFLLLIIVFALSIIIGANNDQMIVFNYLLAKSDFRLSTLLALLFGAGFLLSWLLSCFFLLSMKIKLTSERRKLKKLQKMYDDELANRKGEEFAKDSDIK